MRSCEHIEKAIIPMSYVFRTGKLFRSPNRNARTVLPRPTRNVHSNTAHKPAKEGLSSLQSWKLVNISC